MRKRKIRIYYQIIKLESFENGELHDKWYQIRKLIRIWRFFIPIGYLGKHVRYKDNKQFEPEIFTTWSKAQGEIKAIQSQSTWYQKETPISNIQ